MKKEERNRKRMGFWIDYGKDDELVVAETIDDLKKERKFQRAIFQGIQLIASLWEGRVDVLLSMFPWVADTINQNSPPPKPDNSELERQIADLKMIILQQGFIQAPPKDYPQSKSIGDHVSIPAAPAANVQAAKALDAGEIVDNFMAFLQ